MLLSLYLVGPFRVYRAVHFHRTRAPRYALTLASVSYCPRSQREISRSEVVDCWQLLVRMLHEPLAWSGDARGRGLLDERQYTHARREGSSELKRRLVAGTMAYLEDEYLAFLARHVELSREKAGGQPGAVFKVRAFVKAHKIAGSEVSSGCGHASHRCLYSISSFNRVSVVNLPF